MSKIRYKPNVIIAVRIPQQFDLTVSTATCCHGSFYSELSTLLIILFIYLCHISSVSCSRMQAQWDQEPCMLCLILCFAVSDLSWTLIRYSWDKVSSKSLAIMKSHGHTRWNQTTYHVTSGVQYSSKHLPTQEYWFHTSIFMEFQIWTYTEWLCSVGSMFSKCDKK